MTARRRVMWLLLALVYGAIVSLAIASLSGLEFLMTHHEQTAAMSQASATTSSQTLNGTVEGIDAAGMRVIVQTKKGMALLQISDEDVLRGLMLGDSVTIKFDEQGRVLAIIKNNAPKIVVKDARRPS